MGGERLLHCREKEGWIGERSGAESARWDKTAEWREFGDDLGWGRWAVNGVGEFGNGEKDDGCFGARTGARRKVAVVHGGRSKRSEKVVSGRTEARVDVQRTEAERHRCVTGGPATKVRPVNVTI
jgi:hypothetical protein